MIPFDFLFSLYLFSFCRMRLRTAPQPVARIERTVRMAIGSILVGAIVAGLMHTVPTVVSTIDEGRASIKYQLFIRHAKTIYNSRWRGASIGSMSSDNRSLAFNNEANVLVLDTAFEGWMDSVFMHYIHYIAYVKEITLPDFARQAWPEKLVEYVAEELSYGVCCE
jgi:hypothetical protein